jgi:hypothetical protein
MKFFCPQKAKKNDFHNLFSIRSSKEQCCRGQWGAIVYMWVNVNFRGIWVDMK